MKPSTPTQAKGLRVENPAHTYRVRMIFLVVLLLVVAVVSLCSGRYVVSPWEMPAVMCDLFTQWVCDVQAWWSTLFSGTMSPLDVLFGTGASGADLSGTSSTVMLTSGVTTTASGDLQAVTAVGQVRLPRVLVCMVVGAALSVAGAAYQGMFQNPMASQDVLGASSGAAFGAALGLFLGVGALFTSVFAFGFGLLAVFVSYAISRMSRSNRILSMVLAGMVISSLFSSGTSFLKLVADTESILPAITYWLMGSLSSVRASDVAPVFLLVALALVPLYLVRWRINLLATGEEEALAMGLNAGRLRILVIVCATFLTATCISVCGLIGWVGLVIPHFCRLIFGSDYRRVIPACILAGAAFLLIVDDCSRLFTTSEIPIGILTSFVGAPVFIWLIARGGGAREKR